VESCGLVLITRAGQSNQINMSSAGYSGTPLLQKLGIKRGMKILLMHAPENYALLLKTNIEAQLVGTRAIPDLVYFFAKNNAGFKADMKKVLPLCKKNAALTIWVSWYKKAAGIPTDLTENVIRNWALQNGLVDIKVCAVSDIWSGLKLVVPVAKR
jgi:hypothetical protein